MCLKFTNSVAYYVTTQSTLRKFIINIHSIFKVSTSLIARHEISVEYEFFGQIKIVFIKLIATPEQTIANGNGGYK